MPELTLNVTPAMAQLLWVNATRNFVTEQPERFRVVDQETLAGPEAPVYVGGTLQWCATAADALMLLAFERSSGHASSLLTDGAYLEAPYVVLSARQFDAWWPVAAGG